MVGTWKRIITIALVVLSFEALSVDVDKTNQGVIENIVSNSKINKIPYLDNRFRIDANIEEVTMVFYRLKGTTPIILVRPDGSKITALNFTENDVVWYDDLTYDMVTIKNPMPGPWQVLGDIDPTSKIMVISDIELHVDPLPELLLTGETLKVQARVTNGGEAIKIPQFSDVIGLKVSFRSTNNPDFDNFAAGIYQIADIKDDGLDFDERARDGVFTGEFKLDLPAGEWQPIYTVIMPNLVREILPDKVILHDAPFTLSVERSEDENVQHKIFIEVDDKAILPASLAFQGKVILPNKMEVPFSLTESEQGNIREFTLDNKWVGIHRVRTNAFGETINGREFMLAVGEFAFNVEPPPEPMADISLDADNLSQDELSLLMDGEISLDVQPMPEQEPENNMMLWVYIGLGNLGLIGLFFLGYWLIVVRKSK